MLRYGTDLHNPPFVYMRFNILCLEHLSGNDGQVVYNEAYTCSKLRKGNNKNGQGCLRERERETNRYEYKEGDEGANEIIAGS